MIDLHMHTTCSDGQFSPAETMELAYQAGITAVAVTDHDAVSGIEPAQTAALAHGMTFFPGIEISVQGKTEVHMLGYGVDAKNQELHDFCQEQANQRKARNFRLFAYLERCGVPVTLEEVQQCNQGRASGRPHFARTLVQKGFAESVQDAFERYLATPEFYATVERPKPSVEEGIRVLRCAGGVAVLAHPHRLQFSPEQLEAFVKKLKGMGLQGIEAYYSRHTKAQTKEYLALAQKYELLVTAGSDFHGPGVKPEIAMGTGVQGSLCISDAAIPAKLEAAIRAAHASYPLEP